MQLLPGTPLPALTDTEGLIDLEGRLKAALAAWAALTPEQRRTFNKEAWLANEQRQRAYAADQQKAYDARLAAERRKTVAENHARAAAVFAKTCGTCFEVKTPAGTCNCTG